MITKHKLECFYVLSEYKNHVNTKKQLLELIDRGKYNNPINDDCEVNISKTDWHRSTNFERPWVYFIKDFLSETIQEMVCSCGYDNFVLEDIWFQQYLNNSQHGWHTHSSNFTGVYYVELPESSPKTLLIEPYSNNIIQLEVKEGDVVMFPSFTIHKAPKNLGEERKTIVSFNVNWKIGYTKETYIKAE